ncbi:SUMF1/EgtB/PvdO family nonheme iron enzyme [Algivirga pacifica]|uniref:Sulfatase-modifying factor enzyme-like domain-containing protein n=1 Tax=Algivirga pacifica TaxID=1162670 RepID=A0ABP9D520_9BACT
MNKIKSYVSFLSIIAVMASTACSGPGKPNAYEPGSKSTKTGLSYVRNKRDANNEDFEVRDFKGMPEVPDMVYIEGGRMTLGSMQEDPLHLNNNIERTVTVSSFFMDQTEVANIHWLEYLHAHSHYNTDSSNTEAKAFYDGLLPDTTVWVEDLAYNDQYRDHYLRYPGFRFFPVVGVSWVQANEYSKWRTQVVNKRLALNSGDPEIEEVAENIYHYLPLPTEKEELESQQRLMKSISLETGVVLPSFRLPTEAEWDYAAQAMIGLQDVDEIYSERRIYPWDGHSLRNPYGEEMGNFMANFKRGRGDYAGIGGQPNDGAAITQEIFDNPPNDFMLYNMAGNVSEWVLDVYRPTSYEMVSGLNPVRRDGAKDPQADYNDMYGGVEDRTYISNKIRVYKGGSWKDSAYWLAVGTRRFLHEEDASSAIGFRCAMTYPGRNR